jgi:hypothetical protein
MGRCFVSINQPARNYAAASLMRRPGGSLAEH